VKDIRIWVQLIFSLFRFVCSEGGCTFGTNSKPRMQQHMAMSHSDVAWHCPHCLKKASYENKARHLRGCLEKQALEKEKLLLCWWCPAKFMNGKQNGK
jgi:hypothetical protein